MRRNTFLNKVNNQENDGTTTLLIGADSKNSNTNKYTKKTYFWLNLVAGILHLLSAAGILVLSITNDIRYCIPLSVTYPYWNILYPGESCFETVEIGGNEVINTCNISYTKEHVASIEGTTLLFIFPLISALFHFFLVFNQNNYFQLLLQNGNYWRWVEYSISAPIMLIVIGGIMGIDDLFIFMSLFISLWTVNLLGMVQDFMDQFSAKRFSKNLDTSLMKDRVDKSGFINMTNPADRSWIVRYSPTIISWILYTVMWSILFTVYAYSAENNTTIPDFVTMIIVVMFILFTSFGGVHMLYISGYINYMLSEILYVNLSFISKFVLTWIVYFSMFPTADVTVGQC